MTHNQTLPADPARFTGAPVDALDELCRPFARVDQARASTGNVGSGLAIVDKFAGQHGGRLDYRNRSKGGFEALLRLPINHGHPLAGDN